MLLYPGPMAGDVLRNFRDFIGDAPDEVGGGVALMTAPPEEFVPEPARGQPAAGVIICYAGPVEDAEEAMRPLTEFGPPAIAMVGPMPYVAVQKLIEPGSPAGMRNYWNADFLAGLPDEAIEILCRVPPDEAIAAGAGDPRSGRRGDLPRPQRRDGVRAARGSVQPPHPDHVAGPVDGRCVHRLDQGARRRR